MGEKNVKEYLKTENKLFYSFSSVCFILAFKVKIFFHSKRKP